jgi:hypothetical protein
LTDQIVTKTNVLQNIEYYWKILKRVLYGWTRQSNISPIWKP